jgi:photosystem II stability/assembly factor-like uncharacterized protein
MTILQGDLSQCDAFRDSRYRSYSSSARRHRRPPPKAAPAKSSPAKPATPAAAVPKFKAIWEPVPFNKDLDLNAIACVGPEKCWVVGDKSTILLTTDGGKTWQVQLGGDPKSTDEPLKKVFFLDEKNGWAMTDGANILGTRDGSTWAELSNVSGTIKGVWFQSPQTGLEIENPSSVSQSTLQRSEDAGKTWIPLGTCSVETTIGGLPRKLECMIRTMQFLSPTVGFQGGSADGIAVVGRTGNGGSSWANSVIPETTYHISGVHFWTEKDGIVVLSDGEGVYWTADAGATWTKSAEQRLWPSYFGVGDGKIIVEVKDDGGIAYSFNGGRTFTSRPFTLPARPPTA